MADTFQGAPPPPIRPRESVTCPDCGTRFGRQPDLDRHLTPKVACPVGDCDKAFRRDKRTEFLRHVERKHPGLDSQLAKEHFRVHKDVYGPVPGLCASESFERPIAEPQAIQIPAQQPRFSAMSAGNGSLDTAGPRHDPRFLSNEDKEPIQSAGLNNSPNGQNTVRAELSSENQNPNLVEPPLVNQDPNLVDSSVDNGAPITGDPLVLDFNSWLNSSSLADPPFTWPK